ncbi:carbonic anhydrase [Actinomycetospora corticicola]|uniref:carbonic anhydrase n=1 Tax=Actinomycetospora corticicola TaxID=663602 RepID=A0A7Y9J9I4_9PSEU|nr:carbonic anhydrase [Actinomycetospora corticicola]
MTCLDPRTDPAAFLGLGPGEGAVIRNAGGRVTPTVLADLAFVTYLSERKLRPEGPLFEIAVVHHTQCGTHVLADDAFRQAFMAAVGEDVAGSVGGAVTDPASTVRHDVGLLRASGLVSARGAVSGHVYDLDTGTVTTVVPA